MLGLMERELLVNYVSILPVQEALGPKWQKETWNLFLNYKVEMRLSQQELIRMINIERALQLEKGPLLSMQMQRLLGRLGMVTMLD